MKTLWVLTWFLCTAIPLCSLERMNEDMINQFFESSLIYQNVFDTMLEFQGQIPSESGALVNGKISGLEGSEAKRLKAKNFSACYQDWMGMLRANISSLIVRESPCSPVLNPIKTELDELITQANAKIGPVRDRVRSCIYQVNCTSGEEISDLTEKVYKLKNNFRLWKDGLPLKWNKLIDCYDHLSAAVSNKLSKLSAHAHLCGNMSYDEFLSRFGLLPLSLNETIGFSVTEFMEGYKPPPASSIDAGYRDPKNLDSTLDNLVKDIRSWLNGITAQIVVAIRSENKEFSDRVTDRWNKMPAEIKPPCYESQLSEVIDTVKDYYEGDLRSLCFSELEAALNKSRTAVDCDLDFYTGRLKNVRYCWADEVACRTVYKEISKFKRGFNAWKGFFLAPTMDNAETVYQSATQSIMDYIEQSTALLQDCRSITLPNLTFERYSDIYPSFGGSESCLFEYVYE